MPRFAFFIHEPDQQYVLLGNQKFVLRTVLEHTFERRFYSLSTYNHP